MSDERAGKRDAKEPGATDAEPSAKDAPPAPAKAVLTAKRAGPGTLRTGGCLLALMAFMALLAVFALVYRPPTPAPVGPQPYGDADADTGPVDGPPVRAVAVSPDGTLVAYAGEAQRDDRWVIRFVGVADHRFTDRDPPRREIPAHAAPIRALLFLPDGRELFSASLDGTVGCWNVETGKRISTLTPPGPADESKGLLVLAVSADGRYLAAGGWSGDVYVWDLTSPGATPLVFRSDRGPWPTDPKELKPAGHVDEVRSLAFLPGTPPMLVSGGADGLLAIWDLAARKAGRIVTPDGKQPNIRDLRLRQLQFQRDRDFTITALLDAPARPGLLAADYRGCVYQLTTEGPCRNWWLGAALPNAPAGCIKALLDKKKFCVPFERVNDEGEAAFLGLLDFPGLVGGWVGIAWNDRFRVFRAADALPWRTFEGATQRREWICAYAAAPAQRFVVTGGEAGHLRLYELLGEPTTPDIRLGDQL